MEDTTHEKEEEKEKKERFFSLKTGQEEVVIPWVISSVTSKLLGERRRLNRPTVLISTTISPVANAATQP